jgi:tRNA pseudouridine55 synthase
MLDKNILLINKPMGISSAQAVNRIKKVLNIKKAGHAGTLDKEASGLLIVGLDKGTKKLPLFQKLPKTYKVKIKLGVKTETDDLSGKIIEERPIKGLTQPKLENTIRKFIGQHPQVPPLFSAVKLKGKPAYKLARKGQKPKLKPKKVELFSAEILEFNPPWATLTLQTSKGFYVRSLVRDLGEKLGCGATVAELIRTAIGPYLLSQATSSSRFVEDTQPE